MAPPGPPEEPRKGDVQVRGRDVHFAPVRNSFPAFGAEVVSADGGAEQLQLQSRPVPPPLLHPGGKCSTFNGRSVCYKELVNHPAFEMVLFVAAGERAEIYPIFVTLNCVVDISLTESVMRKE